MTVLQRETGRRVLFREIRANGPVARIDLAARSGLSRATVTGLTADLLRAGLIEEVARDGGDAAPARGRPRVDLKIRGAARLVAGLRIGTDSLSLVLLDFGGARLAELEQPMTGEALTAEALAKRIAAALETLAQRAGRAVGEISGLGVAVAGVVDAVRGLVHWSPSLTGRNVEFAQILADHLGMPAFVDNDANLVALAESLFGLARGRSDFLVVTIESGVGLGLFIGGRPYRGTRGCGAEFGHVKVELDGAPCRCGQRGCLEAYVADYALAREAAALPAGAIPGAMDDPATAVLAAARDGNRAARRILDRAGQVFAMGLANLVNLFDPSLIILAGERMPLDHLYDDPVLERMQALTTRTDRPPPEIRVHKWGDLMWARGAGAFALDEVANIALAALDGTA
ncbi:Sugar kinase of the NBD/HSP70 family, may contain an N-terminal HTH domain [Cribrihabitans marinus]|uniref:Sugar kinase of the NBD/HSP70 family, may contain an N-terminal HTH domain n=1 Tax=Cribrihabitans marinus TaxID=1227549 RepID=A0A1H6SXB0_9RHOB|nr:ROK family transcriptional regulator [Cribrihabitans marinus]GGH23090.1 xylose operon repressor [Cribrihabitans marinus]SEI69417.1 Sugar kinase of the NBD/HSP70 family, may contain an N-terminal HTH domain [Cribrihabitans marinus]